MDHKDLCEHTRIKLIASAIGHQQCTKTASNIIPLPGTDRVIAIGTPEEVRGLLGAAPLTAPAPLTDELRKLQKLAEAAEKDGQHIYTHPRDSNKWQDNAQWHYAAKPEVFLSLIARIAELEGAKAAPAAPVQTIETDISARLRAKAKQPFGPEDFVLLTQAADECDRFYNGMMNWKANAGGGTERDAFNVWARTACNLPVDVPLNLDAVWTKAAWEGWLGRASTSSGPTQRAQFEAWATRSGAHATLSHVFSFTPHPNGARYYDGTTELCWRAWQAAHNAPSPANAKDAAHEAIKRACRDMPDNYKISIELERGCGCVLWRERGGDWHAIDGEGYISDDIDAAIDAAMAAVGAAGQEGGDK